MIKRRTPTRHTVDPYTRKDGTRVDGYYRGRGVRHIKRKNVGVRKLLTIDHFGEPMTRTDAKDIYGMTDKEFNLVVSKQNGTLKNPVYSFDVGTNRLGWDDVKVVYYVMENNKAKALSRLEREKKVNIALNHKVLRSAKLGKMGDLEPPEQYMVYRGRGIGVFKNG